MVDFGLWFLDFGILLLTGDDFGYTNWTRLIISIFDWT